MNHYEVLGVARDATHAQIRKAFRKAASANHPDKEDGDAAEMAAINVAFEVLSDPERRKHYDETGADAPLQSVDDAIDLIVMQAFAAVVERSGNMAKNAHDHLLQVHRQALSNAAQLHNKIEELQERRKKIGKKSAGRNLAYMVIDERLANMESGKAQLAANCDNIAKAIERSKDYTDSEPINPFGAPALGSPFNFATGQ